MIEEWYYIDNSADQPNGHFRHATKANVVFCDGHIGTEKPVAGSIDPRLPSQYVARLRNEILELP
jgi:prepilin-type processing-associated H-X9-DG protein